MSHLATNLRQIRESKGLTVQELALKARLGTATIEKYESGEKLPDSQTILKLSTVLDIPASELLEKATANEDAGLDPELNSLITEIGIKKAKLILRLAKDRTEHELLTSFSEENVYVKE